MSNITALLKKKKPLSIISNNIKENDITHMSYIIFLFFILNEYPLKD